MVLVHGIWMTGLEMTMLSRRLRQHGFTTRRFYYPSLRCSPAENADNLYRYLKSQDADRVHLVAHSLGGIVLLHLFEQFSSLPPGRVVLLGSPAQGSAVARQINRHSFLRPLLGQCTERGLLGDVPDWRAQRDLGVIAGSAGVLGIGRFVGGLSGAHDGTVAVSETEVSEAKDTMVLDVGHFDMLFSAEVSRQAAHFLKKGQFLRK